MSIGWWQKCHEREEKMQNNKMPLAPSNKFAYDTLEFNNFLVVTFYCVTFHLSQFVSRTLLLMIKCC